MSKVLFTIQYEILPEKKDDYLKVVKEELKTHLPQELDEKLLSPEETRKVFDPPISKVTIINWTKAGKLTAHRIGGRVYYKRSEIIIAATMLKKYNR